MASTSTKPVTNGLGPWNEGERLTRPHGLCCVGDHVYICDTDNHFLRRADSTFLDTLENVAGIGRAVWGRTEGQALTVPLTSPTCVFPGSDGILYISSAWEGTLMEYKDGRMKIKLYTGGEESGGRPSALESPTGGCVGSRSGILYIADSESCKIRCISKDNIISSIGNGAAHPTDGNFSNCSFNEPMAICEGKQDIFYVAEYSTIRIIDIPKAKVTTLAGSDVTGFFDGSMKSSKFYDLKYLVYCNAFLFVSDFGNGRIRCIDIKNNKVTTVANLLDDHHSKAAPWGLCLTPRGDLIFSQPKINQISLIRDVVRPSDVASSYSSTIRLGTPLEYLSVSLSALDSFPRQDSNPFTSSLSDGAGVQPSSSDSKVLPNFLELVSPSTVPYLDRFYNHLDSANLSSSEMHQFLYTEQIPASWTDFSLLNAIVRLLGLQWLPCGILTEHALKISHVAHPYRETLFQALEKNVRRLEVTALVDLLSHVDHYCKGNRRCSSIIALAISDRLKEDTSQTLPVGVSLIVKKAMSQSNSPDLAASGTVPLLHGDSYLRNRLEWLYTVTVAPRKEKDFTPVSPSLECNFTLVSDSGHKIYCHDWILYARWPYFRFLVESGANEWSISRTLSFPDGTFHTQLLRWFVQYLYTNRVDGLEVDNDLIRLLSVAQQFRLVRRDSDRPVPVPGFEFLISTCANVFNQLCTLQNCVQKYRLSLEYGSETQQARIEKFIHEHFHTLLKDPTAGPELLGLGSANLGRIWVRANGGPREIDD